MIAVYSGVWLCNNGACPASGLIPSFILCTPVLNSYSAQPNFGAPASPAGSNPARPGGFPGANSPGPVADLYGTASQDSGVGNYISAASPQPGSGFGHGIAVSTTHRGPGVPARVGWGRYLVTLRGVCLVF
uniref:Uncharacterized protein n=1 Tax=Anas platyrhynchos platyrhynchos TaxID=8840 RepID=A0A493U1Q1_ANAPP